MILLLSETKGEGLEAIRREAFQIGPFSNTQTLIGIKWAHRGLAEQLLSAGQVVTRQTNNALSF